MYNTFEGRYNAIIQHLHGVIIAIDIAKNGQYNTSVKQKYNKWGEM